MVLSVWQANRLAPVRNFFFFFKDGAQIWRGVTAYRGGKRRQLGARRGGLTLLAACRMAVGRRRICLCTRTFLPTRCHLQCEKCVPCRAFTRLHLETPLFYHCYSRSRFREPRVAFLLYNRLLSITSATYTATTAPGSHRAMLPPQFSFCLSRTRLLRVRKTENVLRKTNLGKNMYLSENGKATWRGVAVEGGYGM